MAMARHRPDAFPCRRPWQDCALMHPQAAGHGKIAPRCVPEGASDEKNTGSRQHIACMHSDSAYFGKICVLCIRKAPQSAVGEYTARTSCHQRSFSPSEALKSCTAHESCRPLMDLPLRRGCIDARLQHCAGTDGPSPAQGLPPGQPHRGIAFQRPGPCPGAPAPSASPVPATCQCLPLAVPIAVRDKPPMDFGGDHPAHGLQFGQAPRDRRLRHLDGQADNGMLRRTGPGFQNREQVGAEAPAEAAGPAGPASALPKTPTERTSPSWRNYRSTP